MTPLLNIEDLCQDDVLSDLLDARATWNPGFFRALDGRSVGLGLLAGTLKLRIQGRISFAPGAGYSEAESYGISFQDESDVRRPISLSRLPAGFGMLQLEAQCRVYDFLVSCAGRSMDTTASGEGTGQAYKRTDSYECLSLLNRSSRLDYCGKPETVDLKYLDILVKASLNEALDDLWLLRADPESWVDRLHETPTKPHGRASNLLYAIFHRIDIFQSLSLHLDAVQEHVELQAKHDVSAGPHPPDLASLYAAFQSCLDEELCRLHNTQWAPDKRGAGVFSRLFSMAKDNDPTVWVMDLASVMRVIDREIRTVETDEEIPMTVMQALNDISVLAVCVRQA